MKGLPKRRVNTIFEKNESKKVGIIDKEMVITGLSQVSRQYIYIYIYIKHFYEILYIIIVYNNCT